MSTRAYKIIEIKESIDPTFNFTQDTWLINNLRIHGRSEDGIVCIDLDDVKDCQYTLYNDASVSVADKAYYSTLLNSIVDYRCY